jgi:hypothetical protein
VFRAQHVTINFPLWDKVPLLALARLTKLAQRENYLCYFLTLHSLSKLYNLVSFVIWFFYHNSYMIVVLDSNCFLFGFFSNQTLASFQPVPPFPLQPFNSGGGGTGENFIYLKIFLFSY